MYSANLYNANIKYFYSKKEQKKLICDLLYDFRTFTFGTSKSNVYDLVDESTNL